MKLGNAQLGETRIATAQAITLFWQPEPADQANHPDSRREAAAWRDMQKLQQSADSARVALAYRQGRHAATKS